MRADSSTDPQAGPGDLQYNEYIVYSEAQVEIKYLLFVKFDFSRRRY